MAVIAPLSGTLSDRVGTRLPGAVGMGIMAAGLFLMARLGPETPWAMVALSLAVVGLGTGTFISPNNSALMGAAPRSRQGIAAGILATARNLGMVLGVGLAGAIFTTILTQGGGELSGEAQLLYRAVQASFLAAGGISILGVISSAGRGNSQLE
jgi:MFS family permease